MWLQCMSWMTISTDFVHIHAVCKLDLYGKLRSLSNHALFEQSRRFDMSQTVLELCTISANVFFVRLRLLLTYKYPSRFQSMLAQRHDVIRAGYTATAQLPEDASCAHRCDRHFSGSKVIAVYSRPRHSASVIYFLRRILTKAGGESGVHPMRMEESTAFAASLSASLACPASNVSTLFWGATDDMFVKLILIKQKLSANGAEQHWFFPEWRLIVVIASLSPSHPLRRRLCGILLYSLGSSRLASDMRK